VLAKLLFLLLFTSPFFKGGLRGFKSAQILICYKNIKATPSVPLLKKGEARAILQVPLFIIISSFGYVNKEF